MVSDIYRNILKSEEGIGSQHWSVSTTDIAFVVQGTYRCLGSKEVSDLDTSPVKSCILCSDLVCPENLLPHSQGSSLGATN